MTVAASACGHLAHAPEWAGIIDRAYGHEPARFSASDASGARAQLTAAIVRRPLVGTVVTSMPFLDGGGPCGAAGEAERSVIDQLLERARGVGARLVELRCGGRLDRPWIPSEHKVNLVRSLTLDAAALWSGLDRSVRNQVRKAERAGLAAARATPAELDQFYRIFAGRMRDLGSPVHGRQFFRAIFDAFGDRARLMLVRKDGIPIGGLVAVACGGTITVPWASCLQQHFALCPNMLLYWETIRAASADGFRQFDFGRSTPGSGTYRFKRQWGAAEQPLFWYRVSPDEAGVAPSTDFAAARDSRLAAIWRRLPLSLTEHVGPHIRKYLVQ